MSKETATKNMLYTVGHSAMISFGSIFWARKPKEFVLGSMLFVGGGIGSAAFAVVALVASPFTLAYDAAFPPKPDYPYSGANSRSMTFASNNTAQPDASDSGSSDASNPDASNHASSVQRTELRMAPKAVPSGTKKVLSAEPGADGAPTSAPSTNNVRAVAAA